MGEKHEFKVVDTVLLKVGRNEVKVKILNPMAGGSAFMVKSLSSGKAFMVQSSRLTMPTGEFESSEPKLEETAPVSVEPETDETQNPAPEAASPKRVSLMDAAVAVLRESGGPMNTREMVKAAAEKGYWSPTACKTPEQTLYGNIFREIKTKDPPASSRAMSRESSNCADRSLTLGFGSNPYTSWNRHDRDGFPLCRRQASLFGVRSPSARPLKISPQGGTVENNIHRQAGRFAPSVTAGLFCESAPLGLQIPQRQITSAAVFALKPLFGAFAALRFRPPAHGRPLPTFRAICQRLARNGRAANRRQWLCVFSWACVCRIKIGICKEIIRICFLADDLEKIPVQFDRFVRHKTPFKDGEDGKSHFF